MMDSFLFLDFKINVENLWRNILEFFFQNKMIDISVSLIKTSWFSSRIKY